MTLTAGHRLGGYAITELIGSGGMGEVYRARDIELGRDVAIKVLPPQFSVDPQRLARFAREAQILASLNHPNIATLHDIVGADGVQGLVLELIDGDTLAERLAAGAPPFAAALDIARQIAAALEVAHEHGIVHRDLKPANVKLRADGTVKLLDFGVAKIVDGEARGSDTSAATITVLDAAHAGGLGTPAYMSPEQVRGLGVDRRADIWAFGCVLYELLTGTRPFAGDTANDTIGAILHREPDLRALPAACPASIRRLLERCLAKDRQQRLQHIGDARLELQDALAHDTRERTTPPQRVRYGRAAAAVAGIAALIALALLANAWRTSASTAARVTRFEVLPEEEHTLALRRYARDLAVSRDGSRIAYGTSGGALTVRSLDSLEPKLLDDVGSEASHPVFSPDGQMLAFLSGSALKTIAVTGGPATFVADVGEYTDRSIAWSDDGAIFVASTRGLLRIVPGRDPELIAAPDAALGELSYGTPEPMPGGRTVLFTVRPTRIETPLRLVALNLDSGVRKELVRGGTEPRLLPTGYLVYAADGALQAVRFDAERLEIESAPTVVAPNVLVNANGTANYSLGDDGTLIYAPAEFARPLRHLTWVDRGGREEPLAVPPLNYSYPRLAPDGRRVVLDVREPDTDIWLWDLDSELLTRLTLDPAENVLAVWSPDGNHVAFADGRSGSLNLYRQPVAGGPIERLTESARRQVPAQFTPDGKSLIFQEAQPAGGWDTFAVAVDPPHRIEPLLRSEHSEMNPAISPDGHWIAYSSDESGRPEIYARPLPIVGDSWLQISRDGGSKPLWSRDGREVFFVSPQRELMAATLALDAGIGVTRIDRLFDATPYTDAEAGTGARPFDVSLDGKRFLMARREGAANPLSTPRIVVVLGWDDELRRLLP